MVVLQFLGVLEVSGYRAAVELQGKISVACLQQSERLKQREGRIANYTTLKPPTHFCQGSRRSRRPPPARRAYAEIDVGTGLRGTLEAYQLSRSITLI